MELLPLLCLCVLTRAGTTFADQHGPLKDRSGENIPGAFQKPSVTILKQTKDWALLQCEVHAESVKPIVQWKDGAGNILPAKEPQVSKTGDSYDIILQTNVTKTDHYRCVATQAEIPSQIHVYISGVSEKKIPDGPLKDRSKENIPGAVSKPSIMILDETTDWALLQCEVHGASPKPKVQWQDGAGNILPAKEPQVSERGGSYDIILQTTVTKTDRYRCVATQEEIKHQIHAETYVFISGVSEKKIPGSQTGLIVAVAVLSAVLLVCLCMVCRSCCNK